MRRATLCLVLLSQAVLPAVGHAADPAPTEARYKALMFGNPAGAASCRVHADGGRDCDYEFNDRGRGPKLHQVMQVDARGPAEQGRGHRHDYFKVPVKETFAREAAGTSWSSQGEQGKECRGGSRLLCFVQQSPDGWRGSGAGAPARQGPSAGALPAGEARLHVLGEKKIATAGSTRTVSHVAIQGLGFCRSISGFDADGSLFADTGGGWLEVVQGKASSPSFPIS